MFPCAAKFAPVRPPAHALHSAPVKVAAFPRLGLATLPTPLEPMQRLTAHLGGPRLWVKREDATGLGFGGNKLRKLDYVLHEAVSSGADTVVSGGVVSDVGIGIRLKLPISPLPPVA